MSDSVDILKDTQAISADNQMAHFFSDPANEVNKPVFTQESPQNPATAYSQTNMAQFFNATLSRTDKPSPGTREGINPDSLPSRYPVHYQGMDNEDIYYHSQPWESEALRSVYKLATSIGGNTTQGMGFILGAPAALITNDLSKMTDNFLTRWGDALDKEADTDAPIYKSSKYTNGDIWQKLGTPEWWLDDGMSRIGLTMAMYLQGAVGSTFGIAATGLDAAGNLQAAKYGGWLVKGLEGLADDSQVGKNFVSRLFNAASGAVDTNVTPALKSYALGLSKAEMIGWNTLSQQGLNARESLTAIREKLTKDKEQGLNNLTDEEINKRAADGSVKSFWESLLPALTGSLVEIPQMFSTVNTTRDLLSKVINPETGEAVEGALTAAKPNWLKTAGKAVLTGIEHGSNESAQVALGRLNEQDEESNHPTSFWSDPTGQVSGIGREFMNNFSDPNGQNNLALGTIQGILTTLFGKFGDIRSGTAKQETTQKQNLYNTIQQSMLNRRYYNGDFAQRNEDGSLKINPDGTVAKDQDKIAKTGVSLFGTEMALNAKIQAIKSGDFVTARQKDYNVLRQFAYNYFGDKHAMDYIQAALNLEKVTAQSNPDRKNDVDEQGNEITPEAQYLQNLQKVQQLKKVYDAIDQRHAGFFDLHPEGIEEQQKAKQFLDSLKHLQYQAGSDQLFHNTELAKNNAELARLRMENNILDEDRIESPSNPSEEKINSLMDNNEDHQKALQEAKDTYKLAIDKEEQRKAFRQKLAADQQAASYTPQSPAEQQVQQQKEQKVNQTAASDKTKQEVIEAQQKADAAEKKVLQQILDRESNYNTTKEQLLKELPEAPATDKETLKGKQQEELKAVTNEYRLSTLLKKFPDIAIPEGEKDSLGYARDKAKELINASYKDQLKAAGDDNTQWKPQRDLLQASDIKELNKAYNNLSPDQQKKYWDFYNTAEQYLKNKGKSVQEILQEHKEYWDALNQQQPTSTTTEPATPTTSPEEENNTLNERYRTFTKTIKQLFTSSTSTSRERDSGFEQKPHLVRSEKFKNNWGLGKIRGTEELHVLPITKNNETHYGLTGLIDSIKGDTRDVLDTDDGVILYAVVRKTKTGFQFVDQDGKVTTNPLQEVIFDFAPSTNLNNRQNQPRYRDEEGINPQAWQSSWRDERKKMLSTTGEATPIGINYVSRGFAQKNKDAGGKNSEQNSINDLVPKEITTNRQVLFVATNISGENNSKGRPMASITTEEGNKVEVPAGRCFIQVGSTIEFADNHKLSPTEAEGAYNTILEITKDFRDSKNLNKQLVDKLNSVIFWYAPGAKGVSDNQFYVNSDGILYRGSKAIRGVDGGNIYFNPDQVEQNKEALLSVLREEFHHISNTELNKFTTYIAPDGTTYPTYQQYLIDNKVLTTSIRKEMSPTDSNFQGRYFSLDLHLNVPEEIVKPAAIQQQPTVKSTSQTPATGDLFSQLTQKMATGKKEEGVGTPQFTNPVAQQIQSGFNTLSEGLVQGAQENSLKKAQEYANRIKAGEDRNKVLQGIPKSITSLVDNIFSPRDQYIRDYYNKADELEKYKPEVLGNPDVAEVAQQREARLQEMIKEDAKGLGAQYDRENKPTTTLTTNTALPKGAALGEKVSLAEFLSTPDTTQMDKEFEDVDDDGIDMSKYSRVTEEDLLREYLPKDDWKKVESWFSENLPDIPIHRVKTILRTTDGGFAWGKFSKAGITLYEAAKAGTGYHEAFHAVFDLFLTHEEKQAIYSEWKAKNGDKQNSDIEEALADQFSRYVLGEKQGVLGKISKFFRDLWNTLKSWVGVYKQHSGIEELFKSINNGYYSHFPVDLQGVLEEKYDALPFDFTTQHNIQQHITALMMYQFFGPGKKSNLVELSNTNKVNVDDFYGTIKTTLKNQWGNKYKEAKAVGNMEEASQWYSLWKSVEAAWQPLLEQNKTYLKMLKIVSTTSQDDKEVDTRRVDNEETPGDSTEVADSDHSEDKDIEQNSKNQVDYDRDIFTLDSKENASATIKLLFATVRDAFYNAEGKIEYKKSPIDGYQFVDFGKAFNTTLNTLSGSPSLEVMMDRLVKAAQTNPSLYDLANKIGLNTTTGTLNYNNLEYNDWRLLLDFYKTMSKQKPQSFFLQMDGLSSTLLPGNRYNMVNFIKTNFIRNLKKDNTLFRYDKAKKQYLPNPGALGEFKELKTPDQYVNFLTKIGINRDGAGKQIMTVANLKSLSRRRGNIDGDYEKLTRTAATILNRLRAQKSVYDVTQQTLSFDTALNTAASLIIKSTKDDGESSFFNIMGEKVQSVVLNNPYATHFNTINNADNLQEVYQTIPYLQNGFSRGSQKLKEGGQFFDTTGERKEAFETGYADGMITAKGARQSAKLSLFNRKLQSFNLNLNGWAIPITNGDKKTEWIVRLLNEVSFPEIMDGTAGWNKTYQVFKEYLKAEMQTAVEDVNRNLRALDKKGSRGKLRLFLPILSSSLIEKAHSLLQKGASEETLDEFIKSNLQEIHSNVKDFILRESNKTKAAFEQFGKIYPAGFDEDSNPTGKVIEGISREFLFKEIDSHNAANKFSNKELEATFLYRTINHIINNVEIHKLFLGDPAFMEDPIKRIPGAGGGVNQAINGSKEFETAHLDFLNRTAIHKADSLKLQPTDLGYTRPKDHLSLATHKDITVKGRGTYSRFTDIDEADAQSKMTLPAYREFKVRNGEWTDLQEEHYQWEMALMRTRAAQHFGYQYSSKELQKHDEDLLKSYDEDANEAVFEIIKPKAFAQDSNADDISKVYWKTSVQPLIPSCLFEEDGTPTNDEKLHYKLLKEGLDGAGVGSAFKVGINELADFYNEKGEFNDTPYKDSNIVHPSWKDTGIQVETQFSQGKKEGTMGSQLTRMSAMNLLGMGKPVDYEADDWYDLPEEEKRKKSKVYDEIKTNDKLLEDLIEHGYSGLLSKLGIEEKEGQYHIPDWNKVVDYIKASNRDLDDNTLAALHPNGDNDGFQTPLEAIPSYSQLKAVLYSLVDKQIASQKMGGGGYVQSSVWGSESKARNLIREDGKIHIEANDRLKTYTPEEPWCEIELPCWFSDQIKAFYSKNNLPVPSNKELIDTLNKTDILSGIGFRIPTQDLNSVEVFKVKRFLPRVMGNTVRVNSEITKKVGSDFDVDKLNTYLKNIYINSKGEITKVPTGNSIQEVQEAIGKAVEKGDFLTPDQLKEVDRIILEELDNIYDDSAAGKLFSSLLGNQVDFLEEEITKDFVSSLKNAEDFKSKIINIFTGKGLQNSYFESLQRLLQLPQNYDKLTATNDASESKEIRNELNKAKYTPEEIRDKNITIDNNKKPLSYGFLLSPDSLDEIRHDNVISKQVTGIAALAQTGHATAQRLPVTMDINRKNLDTSNPNRIANFGDGVLRFPHNTHNGLPTISGIYEAGSKDRLISRGISQVIDGAVDAVKDTWLKELGVDMRTAGTFLMMRRFGDHPRHISFFLNQPIIQDYLNELDKAGINGIYSSVAKLKIDQKWDLRPFYYDKQQLPDANDLLDYIELYNGKMNRTVDPRNPPDVKFMAEQAKMFNEFLKYQEMASDLFKLTQGVNWDTAHISDGEVFHLKDKKYENANNTLFTPASEILQTTHLGKVRDRLLSSRSAIGSFVALENPRITRILNQVKDSFLQGDFLPNDKKYSQLAKKVNNAFINYVLQVKGKYNTQIQSLLLDGVNGVANNLDTWKEKLTKEAPDSPFLDILNQFESYQEGNEDNSLKGVRFKKSSNDVFTRNGYIAALRQLKEGPAGLGWNGTKEEVSLYKDLVRASLIQSGVQMSPNSYSHLIPNEDYSKALSNLIQSLPQMDDLQNFVDTDAFWRNNWIGDTIKKVPLTDDMIGVKIKKVNEDDPNSETISRFWAIPFIIGEKKLQKFPKGHLMKSREASPFLTYTPNQSSKPFLYIPETGAGMSKKDAYNDGNPIANKVYLYKLARKSNGEPITIHETWNDKKTGEPREGDSFIYKAIHAWGSGNSMQEYYDSPGVSAIDNNSFKPQREIDDSEIETALNNGVTNSLSDDNSVNLNMNSIQQNPPLPGTPLKVLEGVYVNKDALNREEQQELFNLIKNQIINQAQVSNKAASANLMFAFGLRWDYRSNNPGEQSVKVDAIRNNTSYGYYTQDRNGNKIPPIPKRVKELMTKATGIDISNYDAILGNIYTPNTFIGNHSDIDEAKSAVKYPVAAINIGGEGSFIIGDNTGNKIIPLSEGSGYFFGLNGKNRTAMHSTKAAPIKGWLPDLNLKAADTNHNQLKEGQWRITLTARRVFPIPYGMEEAPATTELLKQTLNNGKTYLQIDQSQAILRQLEEQNIVKRNC